MIVRAEKDHFIVIRQHDHGLTSGMIATHLALDIEPLFTALYAISHHDWGWSKVDEIIRWNEPKGQPYSFIDYPLEEKLEVYKWGIDELEAKHPYAAYLCSRHYTSFFVHASHPLEVDFRKQELIRQHQLRSHFDAVEEQNRNRNFRILQLCDDLSLAICMNQPGENTHPWFRDGIHFEDQVYHFEMIDSHHIRFMPNLFIEPFEIQIPYRRVNKNKELVEEGVWKYLIVN